MIFPWHNFENIHLGRPGKLGKKLLLLVVGLLCTVSSLGVVRADIWDEVRSAGNAIGDGISNLNEWVGDASRQYENWELEQMYATRPLSEKDLTFDEWKEIKGYTTKDGGILPQGDFSVTDYRQDFGSEIGENSSLRAYLKKVINFALSFLGVIATAMLIYAGYLYVTAGDGDGAEKAKKILIYVAIGIIIILASYAIVNTLIRNVGREGFDDRCGVIDNQPDCDANATCQWVDSQCQTRDFPRTDGSAVSMRGQLGVELVSGGPFYQTNGGYIVQPNTTLRFTVTSPTIAAGNWDIGDGVLHDLSVPIEVPFYDTGMRVIRGQGVSDSSETFSVGVVVMVGEPINPRFSMPTQATFGQPVAVQDQSTTPPRGGSIIGYTWTCLDPAGTKDGPGCPDMSNFKKQFSMTFSDAPDGEYTIQLKVDSSLVDETGAPATATAEKTIWVSKTGGIGSGFTAQFSTNKTTLSLGQSVVADATASRGAVSYLWTCVKDYPGNVASENNACPTASADWSTESFKSFPFNGMTGEELDPKYAGEYYLSLKVKDANDSESQTMNKKIIVLPATPRDRPAARVRYKVSLLDQISTFLQGLKAQSIASDGGDEATDVFPSQTIEIKRGQKIKFETYMPEGSPYESLPYTVTWWWNGTVMGSVPPEGIENYVKTHQLKVVVADKNDQNKKDTLIFNVKVLNNLPSVKIISVETMEDDAAIPPAFARVKVAANDDADGKFGGIREYKIEAVEAGRYLAMEYVPTDKEEIETMINLSPYPGVRAFVFKATVTDTDHEKAFDQSIVMTIDVPSVNDPMVSFTSSKTYAHTEEEIVFYPSSTGFPDGEAVTYTWYWGDGSQEESTEEFLNHAFALPGSRQVKLVAKSETASAEATKMITISSPFGTGTGENRAPVAKIISVSPKTAGDTTTVFSFYTSATDPDGDELEYDWDMGEGTSMDIKSVSYQFETPGTYEVKFKVSDGLLEDEDSRIIIVVAEGAAIPTGDFSNNLESFKDEIGFWEEILSEALANETDPAKIAQLQRCLELSTEIRSKINQLEKTSDPAEQARLNDEISSQLESLHTCGKQSLLDDNVAIGSFANNLESFSEEIGNSQNMLEAKLRAEKDSLVREFLKKCIETAKVIQAKILVLEEENDPVEQQKLNDEITELLKELHKCDSSMDDRFITVRGTPETTFFFYGYAPTSGDRPLFFRWETEDGQHFIGQDISTKFPQLGVFEVKMIVSDGLREVSAVLNVKIEEISEAEKNANLGAEVIDLSNPPKRVEKKAPVVESVTPKVQPVVAPKVVPPTPPKAPATPVIPDGVSAMKI